MEEGRWCAGEAFCHSFIEFLTPTFPRGGTTNGRNAECGGATDLGPLFVNVKGFNWVIWLGLERFSDKVGCGDPSVEVARVTPLV